MLKLSALTDRLGLAGRALAVGGVVLVAGVAAAWLAAGTVRSAHGGGTVEKKEPDTVAKIRRDGTDQIVVPADVCASLGLKTVPATLPPATRNLPSFQGVLNFDNGRLVRVQSPFAGQVIEAGVATGQEPNSHVPSAFPSSNAGLRVGDKVTRGDVLAVVWSADLGAKKSEFVDAVSKLKTDEKTYRRLDELYQINGTAERTVREAERTVQADRVAVERAEATLRAWRVPADEIAALRESADQLSAPDAKRTDPAKWARVEVKAPISGVILEKNVAAGQVVDTTSDLFRIGDVSTLAVWVHLYEEDLPLICKLSLPREWAISAVASPGTAHTGKLERIGMAIDPAQHTALVTGTVENEKGDLRAGMAVTVTVKIPTSSDEIEVPAEAVVEDGRESSVFVRADSSGDRYVRRPVTVVRRSRDTIAIAARSGGLKPGDAVVTSGSLLLGSAFTDLPQPKP
ncbi:membrane-fusion protein : Membrane-fusion protein OS=Singulisphaera acidiphila (strain ATCC BAA-1392 / DSM 18658 / VKM B-2454 / MOB10) GN=Sinac_6759 PE=4 SV=1: HlyD_2 [Gemmata massiliana]|uniref:CzcB-like barrel-sandwich hybrid domain-containing protein n=1 Tax=Gemmata massiliana TaxID=1210884 RepID=A0A6P2CZU6_9BACT|nr:efflux RND transporter periplasmic adaptor subunit [Gemmata massiliana]VTR93645.1 membrane-fusion protein : Membrane-fusion protein OS=Singulisphaera acidiphila (strain ATCC BAA-1392 / DSM 18658 / VKM B-2454 / MOB10) GN=Sinac_6759 PE=4 SV=1: HlyD_2 [Gemmata massiliana]